METVNIQETGRHAHPGNRRLSGVVTRGLSERLTLNLRCPVCPASSRRDNSHDLCLMQASTDLLIRNNATCNLAVVTGQNLGNTIRHAMPGLDSPFLPVCGTLCDQSLDASTPWDMQPLCFPRHF